MRGLSRATVVLVCSFFIVQWISIEISIQTVLQRALHGSLHILLCLLWYVDIKNQLTKATVEELLANFGSQGKH